MVAHLNLRISMSEFENHDARVMSVSPAGIKHA